MNQGFALEGFIKKVLPTETDKGVPKQNKAGEKASKGVISGHVPDPTGSTRA